MKSVGGGGERMFSPPNNCFKIYKIILFSKQQWLYRLTLVIRSINMIKYYIKCVNNLMILSINKEEVDNLDMKYIVNNFIKNINGDVQLENVPGWGDSKTDICIWVQVTISLGL